MKDKINPWLQKKNIHLRVLNEKIDFSIDNQPTRQNEIWLPLITMKPGFFSDTGYRFRQNDFKMSDNWYPGGGGSKKEFYDVTTYNSDTIPVDES